MRMSMAVLLLVVSCGLRAAAVSVSPMPECAYADTEVATNLPFVVGRDADGRTLKRAFFDAIIEIPSGQTNAVYYAGLSNGYRIVVHETNKGLSFWRFRHLSINMEEDFTCAASKKEWFTLKESSENPLKRWDVKKEIVDFVYALPLNSAIVKPANQWLEIEEPSDRCIFLRREYEVLATLSHELKIGDRICTTELYDASRDMVTNVLRQMQTSGNLIYGKRQWAENQAWFVGWNSGRFAPLNGENRLRTFCIGNQLAVPLRLHWEGSYGDLLPFDEASLVKVYSMRAESVARNSVRTSCYHYEPPQVLANESRLSSRCPCAESEVPVDKGNWNTSARDDTEQ